MDERLFSVIFRDAAAQPFPSPRSLNKVLSGQVSEPRVQLDQGLFLLEAEAVSERDTCVLPRGTPSAPGGTPACPQQQGSLSSIAQHPRALLWIYFFQPFFNSFP